MDQVASRTPSRCRTVIRFTLGSLNGCYLDHRTHRRGKGDGHETGDGVTAGAVLCVALTSYCDPASSQQPQAIAPEAVRPPVCSELNVNGRASTSFFAVTLPPSQSCTTRISNGFPVPDPNCTPGAIDPTLTIEVLKDPRFTTRCVSNAVTTEGEKALTYDWYSLPHPSNNSGENQICELDHLVSLELGGADSLDNVWPQCGPAGVTLPQRFFKEKDTVENFLAMQVRTGRMNLTGAQKAIATDWTQFLNEARRVCPEGRCF